MESRGFFMKSVTCYDQTLGKLFSNAVKIILGSSTTGPATNCFETCQHEMNSLVFESIPLQLFFNISVVDIKI